MCINQSYQCAARWECVQAGAARWENVYRPVRPAERMCTGRCGPLRECVLAGAARWENVYRPVRHAESVYRPVRLVPLRLCTGRCGSSLSDCVQVRLVPLRLCTGRCGSSLSDCVQAGARRTVLPYKMLVLTSLVKQSFIFIIKQNKDIECLTCAFSRHHVVAFPITELTRNWMQRRRELEIWTD